MRVFLKVFFLFFTLTGMTLTHRFSDTQIHGTFEQGGVAYGKTLPGTAILLNDKSVFVNANGFFVLPFEREAAIPQKLNLIFPDQTQETHYFGLDQKAWQIENVTGVASKYVSPTPEMQKRIDAENQQIISTRETVSSNPSFLQTGFIRPIRLNPKENIRISGVFGSQRVFNSVPKSPHRGEDIAAPTGYPVMAAAPGRVALIHQDMFYTGKTIMIDHGLGLYTIYVHLNNINVYQGEFVQQSDIIGNVGSTGRATGPHLHWGVYVLNARLNPEAVLRANTPIFK